MFFHQKPVAIGFYVKSDLPNVLKCGQYDCFRPKNVEKLVEVMIRIENNLNFLFNSDKSIKHNKVSQKNEKKVWNATHSVGFVNSLSLLYLSQKTKMQKCTELEEIIVL